jgi:S-adenosylmethionine-diacylglycerol 3-amino-3-carboxypropyl transferase
MPDRTTLREKLYDAWFRRVHGRRLIYNTCWEDPRADRELLQLSPGARVLMITSAGCNALDYLLDDPAAIDCVDVNPKQNALLELKRAALLSLDHADLFRLFGEGTHPQFNALYRELLRPRLSPEAQAVWDRQLHWFDTGLRRSFYFRGASGDVAWLVRSALSVRPRLRAELQALLAASSLDEQRERYARVERELFGPLMQWFVRQPATLTLLGVPRAQRNLIARQYPGGVSAYVQDKLRYLFTELPLKDNYFWRVYLTGRYSPDCCPNYLKPEHLPTLRARLGRLRVHTRSIAEHLREHSGSITHFVLLDHQDWLAAQAPADLADEWQLILARSAPGTRVLLRSAALNIDFLPDFLAGRLTPRRAEAEHWHQRDRVGTYGATWLAEVHA